MTEDVYRSQFRLPYGLYEELKEAATKNHRSLNAEIVARLEASLDEGAGEEWLPDDEVRHPEELELTALREASELARRVEAMLKERERLKSLPVKERVSEMLARRRAEIDERKKEKDEE